MFVKWTLKTWLAGGFVCGVAALFGFVVWRAATIETHPASSIALPVIVAPSGPARVPPDAPGGLQVPHQDKTVFDTFDGGEEVTRPEKLLSRADTPLVVAVETAVKETSERTTGTGAVKRAELEPGMAGVATSAPKDDTPLAEMRDQNTVAPVPLWREEELEGVIPSSASTLQSLYGVQLASFRSLDAAEAAWAKLSIRVPYLLADLSPTVIKVDLAAAGGIFYRLHAGTLPNLEAAAALCRSLKAEALDCLIVRP